MLDIAVSLDEAAALTGQRIGSLWSQRSRGQAPSRQLDLGDVVGLRLAQRLNDRGLSLAAAASVAFAVKPELPHVLVRASQGHRLWLLVTPGPDGVATWGIYTAEQLVNQFKDGAAITDIAKMIGDVLGAARELQRGQCHG